MPNQAPAPLPAARSRRPSLARSGVVAFALVAAAVLLGRLGWPFDLFVHWAIVAAVSGLGFGIALLVGRRFRLGILQVAMAAGVALHPLAFDGGAPGPTSGEVEGSLQVAFANVYTENRDHERLIAWVRERDPDVLALVEVSNRWLAGLEPVTERLPHVRVSPRDDNYGVALYSRYPITGGGVVLAEPWGTPQIDVAIESPGGLIHVLVTHPAPPVTPSGHRVNGRILAQVGRWVAGKDGPVVVCGDFNGTVWSPLTRHFLDETGLHTRPWSSRRPTWPDTPLFPLVAIPIDHVFVKGGVRIESLEVGPSIGSDHRPIEAHLTLLSPPGRR